MHQLPELSSVFDAEVTAGLCSLDSLSQYPRTKEQIPWYPITQGLGEGVSEQKAFVKTAPVVFRRLAALVATACFTKQKVKGLDLKGKVRALGSEHMHGNKSGAKMEGHAVVPASYVSLHSFHLVCFHFI